MSDGYDVQYYREHKPGLDGWSEGWTLFHSKPTEAEALLSALQNARVFGRNGGRQRWRVVSPVAPYDTVWSLYQTSAHTMIDRGEHT